jgi:hypothetical protein
MRATSQRASTTTSATATAATRRLLRTRADMRRPLRPGAREPTATCPTMHDSAAKVSQERFSLPSDGIICHRAGLPPPGGWVRQAAVPFSSARKWSAASFTGHGTWALGAPEMVLPAGQREHLGQAARLAASGRRVLVLLDGRFATLPGVAGGRRVTANISSASPTSSSPRQCGQRFSRLPWAWRADPAKPVRFSLRQGPWFPARPVLAGSNLAGRRSPVPAVDDPHWSGTLRMRTRSRLRKGVPDMHALVD